MTKKEAEKRIADLIEQRMLMSDDPYVVTDRLRDMDRQIDALQELIDQMDKMGTDQP